MKTYEITYHVLSKGCCGRKSKPSQSIRIQASSEDEARIKLRKKIPGARFELVREV